MKLKLLITTLLLISTPTSFAAGSHDDGHGHSDGHSDEAKSGSPIGQSADYAANNRQIEVVLSDNMRITFSPALESLKDGEAVTFIVVNDGKIPHEFSIGTAEEQKAHNEMMKLMPDMKHNDPTTVSVAPGGEAELNWRFKGAQTVVFACNIPGHFEAGMHHKTKIVH